MRYEPGSEEMRLDPVGTTRRIREESPVQWCDDLNFWVVARYDDCWALAKDQRLSFNNGGGFGANMSMDEAGALAEHDPEALMKAAQVIGACFNFLDTPDHTRIRGLVNKAFGARAVEGIRDDISKIASQLLDEIEDPRSVDLLTAYANPLPILVICQVLGIPSDDRATFRDWFTRLEALMSPHREPGVFASGLEALTALLDYIEGLVERRRASPEDDLISSLIESEEAGDQLTAIEVIATTITVFGAASTTTQRLIANGLIALVRNPDQLARFRADRTIAPTAIEELLRFHNPDFRTNTPRTATESIEIRGHTVEEGQSIRLLFGAANRDPERFDDPDTLDLTRPNNRHLTFGRGEHFCLGAPLARLEGEVAITTLLDRFENIELLDEFQRTSTALYDAGFPSVPVSLA